MGSARSAIPSPGPRRVVPDDLKEPGGAPLVARWEDAGATLRSVRRDMVLEEEARPMIAYAGRPLPETPLEDRRPACALRRWTIDPANWDRCTDLSANGV